MPCLSLGFGNGFGGNAGGREVGLAVLLAEMSLAIRLATLLHKFSQLRGPPSFRGLAGTTKRNRRFRRLDNYRREELCGFRERKRRIRVGVRTERRDGRTENIPTSFLKVKRWTALIGSKVSRKRDPNRNGEMIRSKVRKDGPDTSGS